jgi:MFS family permease
MQVPDRFRRHCRLLRGTALAVFFGLLFMLMLGMTGSPWLRSVDATADWTHDLSLLVVRSLPGFGYLWALWAIQRTFGDLGAGRLFHSTVARAMRHIGGGVLAGTLLNVFVVTNLWRWLSGGQGGYLYFALSGIVLGVVGSALILLARLIDQARALQDELDSFL